MLNSAVWSSSSSNITQFLNSGDSFIFIIYFVINELECPYSTLNSTSLSIVSVFILKFKICILAPINIKNLYLIHSDNSPSRKSGHKDASSISASTQSVYNNGSSSGATGYNYGSGNTAYYAQQNNSGSYPQQQQSYDSYYNHWQYNTGYSGYGQWSGYTNYY